MPMTRVAPSILSADFSDLKKELLRISSADYIHVDVMDGMYVPNITFGQGIVKTLSMISEKPLDVHLMIERPENHIDSFAQAGAKIITIHPDATRHPHRQLARIGEIGLLAGIALNPGDPACLIENYLDVADLILVMTVNPGFGGQEYIEAQTKKVAIISEMVASLDREIIIEVDGGINDKTSLIARRAGATMLVAGSYIFSASSAEAAISRIRG
jgi:ribulose-phosphate 3-epimerase